MEASVSSGWLTPHLLALFLQFLRYVHTPVGDIKQNIGLKQDIDLHIIGYERVSPNYNAGFRRLHRRHYILT